MTLLFRILSSPFGGKRKHCFRRSSAVLARQIKRVIEGEDQLRPMFLRILLVLSLMLISFFSFSQSEFPLKPCPNSPNCEQTYSEKKRKNMDTLPFSDDLVSSKEKLKNYLSSFERVKLIEETENYLHYEFVTKRGNYTDDVEFYFDSSCNCIHFRSASRIGYGDLGANKRRMKRISRWWRDN